MNEFDVVFVTRSIPANGHSGGMEEASWQLMQRLSDAGLSVACVTTGRELRERREKISGVYVYSLPGATNKYSRLWRSSAAKLVLELSPPLVVGVSSGAQSLLRFNLRPPVIMQAHGTAADEIRSKMAQRSFRSAVAIPKLLRSAVFDFLNYRKYNVVVSIGPRVTRSIRSMPRMVQPRHLVEIANGVEGLPGGLRELGHPK